MSSSNDDEVYFDTLMDNVDVDVDHDDNNNFTTSTPYNNNNTNNTNNTNSNSNDTNDANNTNITNNTNTNNNINNSNDHSNKNTNKNVHNNTVNCFSNVPVNCTRGAIKSCVHDNIEPNPRGLPLPTMPTETTNSLISRTPTRSPPLPTDSQTFSRITFEIRIETGKYTNFFDSDFESDKDRNNNHKKVTIFRFSAVSKLLLINF